MLIFDTTLRDGEQAAGTSLTAQEKLTIARQLDRLGVDIIEAGFPISSPGDFEAVQTIAREVRRPVICGLAHCRPDAVDRAWEAVQEAAHPRIHVFLSASDIQLAHMLKKSGWRHWNWRGTWWRGPGATPKTWSSRRWMPRGRNEASSINC